MIVMNPRRHNPKHAPRNQRQTLNEIYRRLYRAFGPQFWWPAAGEARHRRPTFGDARKRRTALGEARRRRPAHSAWEMMVGAILTQNTSWTNVEKALRCLRNDNALSVRAVARMQRRRLERLIYSSGFFRQKATRLQDFARLLDSHPTLFRQLTGQAKGTLLELRETLIAQKGIGPETADSILLYAGSYPTFVVDAYTRRTGHRIGLFETDKYHEVQEFFHANAVQGKTQLTVARYNEFHALIVMLAKHFCTSRNPKCSGCPVRDVCRYARQHKSSSGRPLYKGDMAEIQV